LYSFQSFVALLAQHKVDLIIVQTNPPPIVIIAGLVAWICRKPLVVIAMDLYPEALLAFRPSFANSSVARILAMPFAWAYSHARFVVALGPCMAHRLYRKGVLRNRIRVIPNWATGDLRVRRGTDNQLLDQWLLRGCFTILYSGSLGIAHEIDTILSSLLQLRADCPDLRLLCVASGTRLEAAQQAVQAAELESAVLFRKLVPPELLPDTMGLASLALVSMRPGFEGIVVPSKFAGYLARGIPILYIGPKSDISRFIEDASAGACFANGDVQGVCQFLRDVTADPARLRSYGVAAQSYYERHLAIDHGLSAYRGLISDAILR
jgi:glycosyltransferase involved in cell wall biosynthesis